MAGFSYTIEFVPPKIPALLPSAGVEVINRLTFERVELCAQLLAGEVARLAPVNFGHLAQSFGATPASDVGGFSVVRAGLEVTGRVFSSLPHAIVMEEGRRPGAAMPPRDAIALWAQRKLGLSADEAHAAAWVIARSIARKGIEGRHYAQAAVSNMDDRIEAVFAELAQALAAELTTLGYA